MNRFVRQLLQVLRLSFAPPELTLALTGMQLGGVTPFGLDPTIPLYADARNRRCARGVVGGGSWEGKLVVPPAALEAVGAGFVEGLALEATADRATR